MSGSVRGTVAISVATVTRRVRAYFAPVNRATGVPTVFDPAQEGGFSLDAPPAPWVDLGWCSGFSRKAGTKVQPMFVGAPAVASSQVRTEIEATVVLEFESWGKLQMALAAGSQQMNLLATASGTGLNGSGGVAAAAVSLGSGSTATALNVGATAAAMFSVGDLVAVDVDYTGQLGFVGSGASAAYVRQASDVASDVNYVRRGTLNVGQVVGIAAGVLQLRGPLLAGAPAAGMQVSRMSGFVDREGGCFFQEWSGLFCMDGEQGDRVIYYYPRLQAMQGAAEVAETLAGPLLKLKLAAELQQRLPVLELARLAAELGREYGSAAGREALIAVERNNHGAGVLAYLDATERYSRVWAQGGVAGWLTTAGNKPGMVSRMGALLVESGWMFSSRRLLAECRTFVSFGGGRTGAANGTHDDCLLAMAIAQAVRAEWLSRRR